MDFFERIGKKIIDTEQKVAHKTKNMVDISHLNNAISDRENQIMQLYTEIGKEYYKNHRNDAYAEEKDNINKIGILYKEILSFREKLDQIKGVVKCSNCGTAISPDSTFCSSCGVKIEQAKQDICNCPNCRKANSLDNIFCNYCGTKID